jgi:hypothetical protein
MIVLEDEEEKAGEEREGKGVCEKSSRKDQQGGWKR